MDPPPFTNKWQIFNQTRSFLSIDPILNGFAKTVIFNISNVFSRAKLFQMSKNPLII